MMDARVNAVAVAIPSVHINGGQTAPQQMPHAQRERYHSPMRKSKSVPKYTMVLVRNPV
jgi:hypothetical protein